MTRNQNIHIRVTHEEKQILENKAKELGLKVSDFMRQALCYRSIGAESTDEFSTAIQSYINKVNNRGLSA